MSMPDEMYRYVNVNRALGGKPNLACFGVGRRFVRKNADGPHDMASIRKSIADSGFVDRMIVGEYAIGGSDTYSCEKAFRRLQGTVVVG